jgi:hypothetical protein
MAIVHILENDSAGAMTWLTRAVTAGYRPFPKLHDNVLFSSLYERLDYIELKNQLQNERDEELAKVQPYLAGYRKIISAVNLTN